MNLIQYSCFCFQPFDAVFSGSGDHSDNPTASTPLTYKELRERNRHRKASNEKQGHAPQDSAASANGSNSSNTAEKARPRVNKYGDPMG